MVLYGNKVPCSHVKIVYFTTTLLEYTSFVVSTLMMYNPGCVKFRAEAEEVKILPFPTVRHIPTSKFLKLNIPSVVSDTLLTGSVALAVFTAATIFCAWEDVAPTVNNNMLSSI